MKICPFVSHMLGDENSNTWTLDGTETGKPQSKDKGKKGGNVVILGYEDTETSPQTATDTMTEVAMDDGPPDSVPAHLYCLKESCRFYRGRSGDCQFDLIFSMLEENKSKQAKAPQDTSAQLSKDIDKIWKFQTKSVEELIKGLGESEKAYTKSINMLKKDVEKSLSSLTGKMDKSPTGEVKKLMTSLRKKLEERDQGINGLSTTMSDLVLNLHESVTKLENKSDDAVKRIGEISESIVDEASVQKVVEDLLDNKLEKLDPKDVSESIRTLQKRLEDSFKALDNSSPELEGKLEAARKAQTKMENKTAAWHGEIAERIEEIKAQQKAWKERFEDLAKRQDQILEHFEETKKQRDSEQTRTGQKEARKYNNLGVTSFHNGAYEMARDQFLEAVKVDPDFAEAFNNLGLAYTELNEEKQATEAFSRAVELNPSLHAAYNNLGYIFFKKGEYDQAIEMYNEALGRSTHNSSAYTNLGNAYFKLGRTDDAKKAWTKALEIDPGNEKASKNLERIGDSTD